MLLDNYTKIEFNIITKLVQTATKIVIKESAERETVLRNPNQSKPGISKQNPANDVEWQVQQSLQPASAIKMEVANGVNGGSTHPNSRPNQ